MNWSMMLLLLLVANVFQAETMEEVEQCALGFSTRRVCCVGGWRMDATVPLEDVDSVLLMPNSCAIPPFCQSQLPYMDVFHDQAETHCAPHIDAFNTSGVAFIICKHVGEGAFTCYGRASDSRHNIDFSGTSPTPCFRARSADGETTLIRANANACRVNVRLYGLAYGEQARVTSTQPLTFRPILQPALAPFRGEGSTRILLKRDTEWLGEVSGSTLFVDAMMPAGMSKEDGEARLRELDDQLARSNWTITCLLFFTVGISIWVAFLQDKFSKINEEILYYKIRARVSEACDSVEQNPSTI